MTGLSRSHLAASSLFEPASGVAAKVGKVAKPAAAFKTSSAGPLNFGGPLKSNIDAALGKPFFVDKKVVR
eukprot:CAMPEP_0185724934 /NCGR_PEP_ID=MMETSP1171-20130828/1289_1 /TAXON_ID=374046 /ORGANISM="Helicotheca tamensis, Strain CCMP826" /LENGTH=69 /DNA_ID=CAMNT_0028392909 /DNA_START=131 /DNA_END=340 /DNA_ORIENTATION=-